MAHGKESERLERERTTYNQEAQAEGILLKPIHD
jgi:hypothetical protein